MARTIKKIPTRTWCS